jgi:hypothetical protein
MSAGDCWWNSPTAVLLLVDSLLWCSPDASLAVTHATMTEVCIFIVLLLVITRWPITSECWSCCREHLLGSNCFTVGGSKIFNAFIAFALQITKEFTVLAMKFHNYATNCDTVQLAFFRNYSYLYHYFFNLIISITSVIMLKLGYQKIETFLCGFIFTTCTSFQILPSSSFINHPILQWYVVLILTTLLNNQLKKNEY